MTFFTLPDAVVCGIVRGKFRALSRRIREGEKVKKKERTNVWTLCRSRIDGYEHTTLEFERQCGRSFSELELLMLVVIPRREMKRAELCRFGHVGKEKFHF